MNNPGPGPLAVLMLFGAAVVALAALILALKAAGRYAVRARGRGPKHGDEGAAE